MTGQELIALALVAGVVAIQGWSILRRRGRAQRAPGACGSCAACPSDSSRRETGVPEAVGGGCH